MGDCLRRWLAITGLDQHDFAGEIARMQWIFWKAAGVVGMQLDRPAVVNQPLALGAERVPGERSEAVVVRQEVQPQGMAGRLCHGESEGSPNNLTTGCAVTAEQQVEKLVAVYLTRITEQTGRRRLRMGNAREMGDAGQRKVAMPIAAAMLERDGQLEAFAGAAWSIRRHWWRCALRRWYGFFCKLLRHPVGQFDIYLLTLACSPKSLKWFLGTVRANIFLDVYGMRLTIDVYGALESAFGNRRDIQTGQF